MKSKWIGSILVLFFTMNFLSIGCSKKEMSDSGSVAMDESGVSDNQKMAASADSFVGPKNAHAQEGPFKAFPIYTDGNSPDNHYTPSGWMGDYGDLSLDDKNFTNPHGGTTSVKIIYNGKATQGARWAGMYWQNPPNNWGTRPGGYDLTGAKKVTFWARGDKGGERIEEFKIGGITGEYADSDIAGIGPMVLTADWQQFTIDLEGKDLSSISGGFCWAANLDANPQGVTFYLDDIRYE